VPARPIKPIKRPLRVGDEQIACALRQTGGGTPVPDVCRQLGVSEASFCLWKKQYAKLELTEIPGLRRCAMRMHAASAWWPTSRLINTSSVMWSEKSSEASAPSWAGSMDSGARRRKAIRLAQFSHGGWYATFMR